MSFHEHNLVVVHAVPGAWLPPTQTWLYHQVRFLAPFVESHVACERRENADRFALPNVHPASGEPRWRRAGDGALRALRLRRGHGHLARLAEGAGASIVHSHFGPEGWRNLALVRRLGLRHVITFYGYDVDCLPRTHPRWRRRYRAVFDGADAVLCEGEHMAGRLSALGCPDPKLHVHRLGVDLHALPFRPRRWKRPETLHVLLAAAFREKKGLSLAVEALGRLRHDVPLRITIIGDAGADDASRAEKRRLLAAIERHGLQPSVTRLGFQPPDVLRREAYRHHLYVAPSRVARNGDTEGGAPVALIEMAATGMPIVSTSHCDIPGVIRHGTTGFLARENDVDDLLRQIRTMLDRAPMWPAILESGRRRIEARFDGARQGERLAGLYRAVARGWRFPRAARSTPFRRRAA